jgi:hypothetical protein
MEYNLIISYMIEPPTNYYPPPLDNCAPFNPLNYENGYVSNPSVLNPANYLTYPNAQGTELFSAVQISQIQDSTGSYGTDGAVLQGTLASKIQWTQLAKSTSSYQTDVYRSSVKGTGLFDIVCPAGTTKVDIYAVGQGGLASVSGPKYGEEYYYGDTIAVIFGPGTGAAGTAITMKQIPAQEGLCFRGLFIDGGQEQYYQHSTQVYAINGTENILIADAGVGNWAGDPNIGDDYYYPGNGYVGYARGPGVGSISNLTGSLLTIKAGDNGIDGLQWIWFVPMDGSYHPNPPYDQTPSINQAVQFYDENNRRYGSGSFYTNLYVNGNGPGYLHADFNAPSDAAIIVVSYINT